jgi:hypothetical protein
VGVRRGGCGGSGLYCDIDNETSWHCEELDTERKNQV